MLFGPDHKGRIGSPKGTVPFSRGEHGTSTGDRDNVHYQQPYSNRRTCSEGEDVEVTLWGKVVEEEEENFLGTVQSIALQDKSVRNIVLLRLCALVTHNRGLKIILDTRQVLVK